MLLDGVDGKEDDIYDGKYQLDPANVQPLRDRKKISDVWPELPSDGQLHVCVSLPTSMGSPTLWNTTREYFVRLFAPARLRTSDERSYQLHRVNPLPSDGV